jgi:hypothetical protein
MQAITTGIAAILAQVRMFGMDSELLAVLLLLVVATSIGPTNTALVRRSTGSLT